MPTRNQSGSQKDVAGCKPDRVVNRMESTESMKRWETCKRVIHEILRDF